MESHQKIITYTDGGSRGNPGEAALGVVISDEKGNVIKEYGERLGIKTNNEAEYAAVISALKKLKALYGKEKTKKMDFAKVTFSHVPREQNKEADRLVNEALDNEPQSLF